MSTLTRGQAENLLANVAQYLLDGGDVKLARILSVCTLAHYTDFQRMGVDEQYSYEVMEVRGPRTTIEFLRANEHLRERIWSALGELWSDEYTPRLGVYYGDFGPEWRDEIQKASNNDSVHNQALTWSEDEQPDAPLWWNNLRFRSQPEVAIAKALDRAKVLFLPNSRARVTKGAERVTKEPDFLVCEGGKWGILEVDGTSTHPRAAEDHERDRIFRSHGVKVVERFSWGRCLNKPDEVVRDFLQLLRQS